MQTETKTPKNHGEDEQHVQHPFKPSPSSRPTNHPTNRYGQIDITTGAKHTKVLLLSEIVGITMVMACPNE